MIDAIIGGAIAAVIGAVAYAVTGLWLERRHEKAQRLTMIDALITETAENLTICKTPVTREKWWAAPYKLEAYHTYKGQFDFLPEDVRIQLVDATFFMESCNNIIQMLQLRVALGQPIGKELTPPAPVLIEHLEFVNEELLKWRAKHSRSLWFRIRRRLRNFILKIRKNSKLSHS